LFDRQESFFEILTRLQSNINLDGQKNFVNADRDDILDGGFRAFKRKTFDDRRPLSVLFAGEDGIDTGGLRRDFMRLAISAVKNLPIFSGSENSKFIALDYKGNFVLGNCFFYFFCCLHLLAQVMHRFHVAQNIN